MNTKVKSPGYRESVDRVAASVDEILLRFVDMLETGAPGPDFVDQTLITLAECRGHLVRASMIASLADTLLKSAVVNGSPPPPDAFGGPPPELPPVIHPANGKIKRSGLKLKSPFDYDCPTCGADKHTKCFKYDRKGGGAKRLDERHENPHYSHVGRQALSKAANAKTKAAYDAKAVTA